MSNDDFTKLKKFGTTIKVFDGLMYFNIVVVVLLFLALGVNWIVNREKYSMGGAGTVMALLYWGPIIIINMIAFVCFLGLSVIMMRRKKLSPNIIAKLYKKSAFLFGIEVVFSLIAMLCIF